MKVYVKKMQWSTWADDEWIVRGKVGCMDMPFCACNGSWEAKFVRQCIQEACGNRGKSVRLRKMIEELERDGSSRL